MTTARAPERYFKVFRRGEIREDILATMRNHMRTLVNPDTAAPFTETEIAVATARKSRFWIEAEAIDLGLFEHQRNALYQAEQVFIDRAGSSFLDIYHAEQWGEPALEAEGASGTVDQPATAGTIFAGSTTIPDATAYVMTAPDGKRFQNLFLTVATATGLSTNAPGAQLTLKGIDTGPDTEVDSGTVFKPAENIPAGVSDNANALAKFSGGIADESDADHADRIGDRIKHKPASGNDSHIRTFAREATASVEDAFIYATALHAGTTAICVTQKRGTVQGPTGRQANASTLADVTAYLVPPNSPVVPKPPHFIVKTFQDQFTDLVIELALPVSQTNGWTDPIPWPEQNSGVGCSVTGVTSQTVFQITRAAGSADLPSGVTAPSLMIWDESTWTFEKLDVQSVTLNAGDVFDVVLNTAPTTTIAIGMFISPDSGLRETVADAIEQYFDSLGPGEVVDLDNDIRGSRAYRFPEPSEDFPQRAGSGVLTTLRDLLGATLADENLASISSQVPAIPSDVTDGPFMMLAQHVGVYKL